MTKPHSDLPWEPRAGRETDLESPGFGHVATFELERDADYALEACNAYPSLLQENELLRKALNRAKTQFAVGSPEWEAIDTALNAATSIKSRL